MKFKIWIYQLTKYTLVYQEKICMNTVNITLSR